VNFLNASGSIIGSVVYKKCNFHLRMRDFLSVGRHDILDKTVSVDFEFEKVTYNQKEINL
jgi:hypothetical protein